MADLTITIQGVDRLIAKLGKVGGTKMLHTPMRRAVDRLLKYMTWYPAKPPKSRYVRTLNYGRFWTIDIDEDGGGLVGKVGINSSQVPYAPKVGSHQFQARVHRGRWRTDRMAVQTQRSAIVRDFNASIKEALK